MTQTSDKPLALPLDHPEAELLDRVLTSALLGTEFIIEGARIEVLRKRLERIRQSHE